MNTYVQSLRSAMRLVTFQHDDEARVGVVTGNAIVDLTRRLGVPSMRALLDGGLDEARRCAGCEPDASLDDVELLPPVPDPVHVIGVGLNTRSHAAEVAAWRGEAPEQPAYPRLF